jgi:Tfp pilus assembly protein PilN
MTQDINLFSALPPPPKQYLSLEWLLAIIISFTAFLALIYVLSYLSLVKQRSLLAQLHTTKTDLHQQIAAIEQANAALHTKNNVNENNKLPQFSPYLEALAGAVPDGIWLTNIKLSNIDSTIDLSGYATNFAIVPHFFKNLSLLPVFPKGEISILNLARVDRGEQAGGISFQFGRGAGK